jgi:leucyl/phenylalanyl-tRNA--protein transferase
MPVYLLDHHLAFPPVSEAVEEGLLAVGGDLSEARLLLAYRSGIFPWFNEGEAVMWWSPDPRCVILPEEFKAPRSLMKAIRSGRFRCTVNMSFPDVIDACRSVPRRGQDGTWITDDMVEAYQRLHHAGYAHSVESWIDDRLVGGLYGVGVGDCFCGESMFSLETEASKVALFGLVSLMQTGKGRMIDCQMSTPHLLQFGARDLPRERFVECLSSMARKAGPDFTTREIRLG